MAEFYWRKNYDRRKARWTVNDAIKCGKMKRGTVCEMQNGECDGPIEGHHDDYTKPLEVRWLCRKHHRQVDGKKFARPRNTNGAAKRSNAA